MRILDASAFINEYHTDDETASIPLVKEELTGEHAFRFDALEGAGMYVHIPGQGTVDKVLRAAGETGDRDVLSETDTRLIAAAFELDATLVTDDYAMQNVAERLNVGVEVIAQDGIAEQRSWKFQCQGCGREFDENKERCPICGMELSRKNPA
ncbi:MULTISPECIES: NOB1 family endonuclease [Haloferax]|uniref:DNA-binding protein n=3 Tax=Haloferax TaxID=2251 RepID=A0A0K1IUJ2_HALGI|nr:MULTISPECIES: NOB1 family endonuclease [Haloferax]AKU07978.1 DNA-binding protein [Haloferax gibbonsii]ELZ79205.1 Nob1p-like protein [Haloferax gibbonsii ATCC 33959]MDS0242958.1 NOB1 family endonuclease [Haloferax sp. S2CR25]MDS0446079.1 NOB1 family endonuclease [Haloferax sp. S2CR25-2]QOS12938.1 rRNA maturation endonuclease Nob1 [Haloferax gibbonsii]